MRDRADIAVEVSNLADALSDGIGGVEGDRWPGMPETVSRVRALLDEFEDVSSSVVTVYAVLGAAGWPGGYEPWPQTPEHVRAFQREHGGQIRRQRRTVWKDVTPEEVA